jgi:hypothetical protein
VRASRTDEDGVGRPDLATGGSGTEIVNARAQLSELGLELIDFLAERLYVVSPRTYGSQ